MDNFSDQLSSSYGKLIEKLGSWLDTIVLQLPNLLIAIIVGLAAYFISTYVRKLAVKTTNKFTSNKTVLNLISNLTAVVFSIFVLFTILNIFDLGGTINKILATAGVLGLAVGLALQDPMNNLFSGVFMSVRELYKIGDLIESNGYFGIILDIDLRATKILQPSGQEVIIPNKDVVQNPLKNYSITGQRRVDVTCGVSYGDDLDKVEGLVIKAIKDNVDYLESKPVDVVYNEFGDSSINFIARFWINNVGQTDFLMAQSMAIKAIKKSFDNNDIMIPFPITTLDFGIKGGVQLKDMLSLKSLSEMKSDASHNSD
ncbi:MAG: small conductance mechanosensitive channel [Saprospiraceae bacterium]|jgi:small conductance mechanosensitive channel|tara:strand:- start:510 stop:1451 length:942 start_codon:yes stop_codon:yes gene_type:complete